MARCTVGFPSIHYLAFACIGMAQEVGRAMMRRRPVDAEAATEFAVALVLRGLSRKA